MDLVETSNVPSEIMKSGHLEDKSNDEESVTFMEDIAENNFSRNDQVKTTNEDDELSRWLEVFSFLYLQSGRLFCRTCVTARPQFGRSRPNKFVTGAAPTVENIRDHIKGSQTEQKKTRREPFSHRSAVI